MQYQKEEIEDYVTESEEHAIQEQEPYSPDEYAPEREEIVNGKIAFELP